MVVTAIFAKQKIKTTLLVFLSFHLHLLADLVGARGPDGDQWPIPYMLPFSKQLQLKWPGQWALNAWPNVVITAALIAVAVVTARRRSRPSRTRRSSLPRANRDRVGVGS